MSVTVTDVITNVSVVEAAYAVTVTAPTSVTVTAADGVVSISDNTSSVAITSTDSSDAISLAAPTQIGVVNVDETISVVSVGSQGPAGAQGEDAEDANMKYVVRVDFVADTPSAGDTTIYKGWASPGNSAEAAAVWKIQKLVLDSTGDVSAGGFADGDLLFDNIWDNRVALSYS